MSDKAACFMTEIERTDNKASRQATWKQGKQTRLLYAYDVELGRNSIFEGRVPSSILR